MSARAENAIIPPHPFSSAGSVSGSVTGSVTGSVSGARVVSGAEVVSTGLTISEARITGVTTLYVILLEIVFLILKKKPSAPSERVTIPSS